MIQVLFVCLGNICRSPLAEAIFSDLLREKGLNKLVSCNSAGTAGYHIGENPNPRTIDTARKNSIPINHKGRQFASGDFNNFHYVIVMDSSNLRDVLYKGGEREKNVFLMRYFDPSDRNSEVPDPYYGGQSGFDNVFDILSRSCEGLLKYIETHHNLNEH